MHPLSFLQKRAHLSVVARGREMFAGVKAMTPARFDILYLIHERSPRTGLALIAQAEVRRKLGLARQTVWKMVKRLEELGLVKTTRNDGYDERLKMLALTEEGIRRIRQALGAAFTETFPLPLDAPADGDVPRYFRRLAKDEAQRDIQRTTLFSAAISVFEIQLPVRVTPVKTGREVAKVFTSLALKRVHGGRRGRRSRHLHMLESLIEDAQDVARAFGDTSELIYRLDYESDH